MSVWTSTRSADVYEFYPHVDEGEQPPENGTYAISLYWREPSSTQNTAFLYYGPPNYGIGGDSVHIPVSVQTPEEAMAWVVAMWRMTS